MSNNYLLQQAELKMKNYALRNQYNEGIELYFQCLKELEELKAKTTPFIKDKVAYNRVAGRKNYYAKQNRLLDEFITNNIKF